ncbi:MAG: sodium-dependent transporter [Prevotella sp.]|nr:sodium-dependent transporter [Candidatus Prevotella equi]
MEQKTTFATKLGVIFATAGSAVGLGNIWHFPTTCGQSGGAAFILLYLIITVLLGVPGMLSEFIIGRNSGRNSFAAYREAGGKKPWGIVGLIGVLCSSLILGFYSVIAGWCLYYLYLAVTDNAVGTPEEITATFSNLMAPDNYLPCILSIVFVFFTHLIIVRGIRKGIEWASKIMVPTLITLLVMLIVASCTLDNAWKGITFLFKPDFSQLDSHIVFMALGEAFFSLSLGTACLCTYASYFNEETNIVKSTLQIVSIDILVAIMAGLMIFPAAFSVNVQPDAGPSLVFMTMPNVFEHAFPHSVAYVISILFYLLLTIAALTSTISMHEIGTAIISQETKLSRTQGATCVTLFCSAIGLLSALSMSHEGWGLFGMSFFDNFDKLTSNIMLPLGGMLSFLIIGWVMPRQKVLDQLSSYGRYKLYTPLVSLFFILARYICPIIVVCIFLFKMEVV